MGEHKHSKWRTTVGTAVIAFSLVACATQSQPVNTPAPPATASKAPPPPAGPRLFSPPPAPPAAAWLGNENARLDDAPLAVAHNAAYFALALSAEVIVYDRRDSRARHFAGLTGPLALDDTTLVASQEGAVVVIDLAAETPPRVLAIGETPTHLGVENGRLFGVHAKGTFACAVADFGKRAGQLFMGSGAPRFLAVHAGRAIRFEPALRRVTVVSIEGTFSPTSAARLPPEFTVDGAALGEGGAIIFGHTPAGGTACLLTDSVCSAFAVGAQPIAASYAELPVILDVTGRLWSVSKSHLTLAYDPGMVTVPRPLLSTGEDKSLMLVHHQQVTHLVPEGAAFKDVSAIGHRDRVTALSFSPSGRTLFSGALDGTVKAWSVADRRQLASVRVKAELGGVWDVSAVDDTTVVALSSPDHLTLLSVDDSAGQIVAESDLASRRPGNTAAIAVAGDNVFAWGPSRLHLVSLEALQVKATFPKVRLPRDAVTGGALHPSARGVLVAKAPGCGAGGFLDPTSGACTAVSSRVVKARQVDAWESVAVAHKPGTWLLRGDELIELKTVTAPADAVFVVDGGRAAVFVGRSVATKVSLEDEPGTIAWSVPLPSYARLRAVAVSSDGMTIARAGIVRHATRERMHASKEVISLVDVSAALAAARSGR